MHAQECRPLARWSCATEELGLGLDEILALHGCVERIVALGAKTAVVRAHNGELVAVADRSGPETAGTRLIARRLSLADLGVVSDVEIDLFALDVEVRQVDEIICQAARGAAP